MESASSPDTPPCASPNDEADWSQPRQVIFPAQFNMLDEVRDFVAQAAQACCLDAKAVYSVQLAMDEAFTNVVEHAYGGECAESIECTCQVTGNELVVTMKDCGRTFDPNEVPNPDLESELQERQIGGLGLYFMRQLMDEVEFKFLPPQQGQPGCNLLRMVKRKET